MLTLVVRSMGRIARMSYGLGAVLVVSQLAVMAAAVSLQESGSFQRLVEAVPAFVRQTIGPAIGSFAGMTVLAYFEPAILLALSFFAVYVATEPAGDVESGIVDLVLARPLPRHFLITRSLLVMSGAVATMVAVLGASNVVALAWMAPEGATWPEPHVIGLMMAHLAAVMWCFGGLSLGVAAYAERRGAAIGVMALVIVTTFMVHAVEQLSNRFDGVGWFSPFHYFQGTAILDGTVTTVRNLTVLCGCGAAAVAVAYARFSRRDL